MTRLKSWLVSTHWLPAWLHERWMAEQTEALLRAHFGPQWRDQSNISAANPMATRAVGSALPDLVDGVIHDGDGVDGGAKHCATRRA